MSYFVCTYKIQGDFSHIMVISISSKSTIAESSVETPSPTKIMEDSITFIPLMNMVIDEAEHIPFISEVRLGPYPTDKTKSKWSSSHKKETTPPQEVEEPCFVSMLLDYITPHLADAHKIKIDKNEKSLIVKPTISIGFQITTNNGKIQ